MNEAIIRPIGILHCEMTNQEEVPKNFSESVKTGTIEIYPQFHDGLEGLKPGQTIVVLFWLHRADRSTLKVYPRGDRSRGLRGVFVTRSPARPNPIAISELEVMAMGQGILEVKGLDILDGTPVIDIKKKLS